MSKLNEKSMEKVDQLIKLAAVKEEIKRIKERLLEIKVAAALSKNCIYDTSLLVNRLRELENITLD